MSLEQHFGDFVFSKCLHVSLVRRFKDASLQLSVPGIVVIRHTMWFGFGSQAGLTCSRQILASIIYPVATDVTALSAYTANKLTWQEAPQP